MKRVAVCASLLILLGGAWAIHLKENNMSDIKFSVGKNIVETAKATGIPKFGVSNIDGLIQYNAMQLPKEVKVIYDRQGYEIAARPVFSINFSADRARSPGDFVDTFIVKMETDEVHSHAAARAVIDALLFQFKKGMWTRYVSLECPAVTGRSVFLNINGDIDSDGCALDPEYKIADEDWLRLFADGQRFEWLGEGVLAQLMIGYRGRAGSPKYDIRLVFEDYEVRKAVDHENEQQSRKEGDSKGWKTSEKAVANEKATREKNLILEANSLKRGDKVLKN